MLTFHCRLMQFSDSLHWSNSFLHEKHLEAIEDDNIYSFIYISQVAIFHISATTADIYKNKENLHCQNYHKIFYFHY